jgi:hypothetical protein
MLGTLIVKQASLYERQRLHPSQSERGGETAEALAAHETPSTGHCAPRPTTAAVSGAGAFPLSEQISYQQVVGHRMGVRGSAAAALASPRISFHASHTPGLTAHGLSPTGRLTPALEGRVGHGGPFDKQGIVGHRESATLLGTPRLPWMSGKPCRTAEGITGSQQAVYRTGAMALIVRFATTHEQSASALVYAKRGTGDTWRGKSSRALRGSWKHLPNMGHSG